MYCLILELENNLTSHETAFHSMFLWLIFILVTFNLHELIFLKHEVTAAHLLRCEHAEEFTALINRRESGFRLTLQRSPDITAFPSERTLRVYSPLQTYPRYLGHPASILYCGILCAHTCTHVCTH